VFLCRLSRDRAPRFYNTNLESIRKDVECTFGILKKRWRVLDYGLNYYCMKDCEKVFTVCCVLQNMLLSLGENFGFGVVAGRGRPYPGDGLWLEGSEEMAQHFIGETCTATIKANNKKEAVLWQCRRDLLAEHHEYCASIRRS